MPFLDQFISHVAQGMYARRTQEEELDRQQKDKVFQLALGSLGKYRADDLPQALGHLDKILGAKNSKAAHEALGSMITSSIPEDWQQEQQIDASNQAISAAQADQQAQYAEDSAAGGTLVGVNAGNTGQVYTGSPTIAANGRTYATPVAVAASPAIEVRVAPTLDATPPLRDPGAYAKDKLRVATEEGSMARKSQVYIAQQDAQLRRQQKLEESKVAGRIKAWQETHAKELSGRSNVFYDPETNTTHVYGRTKDGQEVHQEFEGQAPASVVNTKSRTEYMAERDRLNREQRDKFHKEEMTFKEKKFTQDIKEHADKITILRQKAATVKGGYKAAFDILNKQWESYSKDALPQIQHLRDQINKPKGPFDDTSAYEKTKAENIAKLEKLESDYRQLAQAYREQLQKIGDEAQTAGAVDTTTTTTNKNTSSRKGTGSGSVEDRVKRNVKILNF